MSRYIYCQESNGDIIFQVNKAGVPTEVLRLVGSTGAMAPATSIGNANGTFALPSITFTTDTDTGLYRVSANVLGFSTAGATAGNIDSTGIWTFPATTDSSSRATGTLVTAGGVGIAKTLYAANVVIDSSAGSGLTLQKSNNQPVMTIKGTASNDQHLSMVSDVLTFHKTDGSTANGSLTQAGAWTFGPTAGISTGHRLYGSTTAATASIDLFGNIHQVGADTNAVTRTNTTAKIGRFAVPHYTNAEESIQAIGVTSGTTTNVVDIGGGSSAFNAATSVNFYTAAAATTVTGTLMGSISGAGLWTIGASGGSQIHAVNGSLVATGDITAFSDRRLKSDIVTIDNAIGRINDMRGVFFTKDGQKNVGFIAQEVMEALPEVVKKSDGEEGYLSVAYGNVTALLLEGVKAQQAQIETQQAQIDALQLSLREAVSMIQALQGDK